MPNIGPMELAIVLIIALVVFGPKRLPELGKSVGSGMREFKDSMSGHVDKQDRKADEERKAAELEAQAKAAAEPEPVTETVTEPEAEAPSTDAPGQPEPAEAEVVAERTT